MFIQVKKLEKSFQNKKILQDISLDIAEGEIFGIIGSSGAGKTTLLRCMSTLERDFSGSVLFEGEPFCFDSPKLLREQRRRLGMIFQHFHLLQSRNVADNILLPLELEGKTADIDRVLKQVGLEGKKDRHVSQLSGGEKQKVAIARALIRKPKVLFCDEATSSLDPKSTDEILTVLQRLNRDLGITIVLITHEMDVVRKVCHQVAVMSYGRVIEKGSTLDIFSQPREELTKKLVQKSSHEDVALLKKQSPESIFLTLHFSGAQTGSPVISWMIQTLQVEVNIMGGWMDRIEGVLVGSLTIAVPKEKKGEVFAFLDSHSMHYEAL